MNPNCKKRMGVIRLETMKVVSQQETPTSRRNG